MLSFCASIAVYSLRAAPDFRFMKGKSVMHRVRLFCALLFCLPLTAQVFRTSSPVKPPANGVMRPTDAHRV